MFEPAENLKNMSGELDKGIGTTHFGLGFRPRRCFSKIHLKREMSRPQDDVGAHILDVSPPASKALILAFNPHTFHLRALSMSHGSVVIVAWAKTHTLNFLHIEQAIAPRTTGFLMLGNKLEKMSIFILGEEKGKKADGSIWSSLPGGSMWVGQDDPRSR